jgi:hypothetical protein
MEIEYPLNLQNTQGMSLEDFKSFIPTEKYLSRFFVQLPVDCTPHILKGLPSAKTTQVNEFLTIWELNNKDANTAAQRFNRKEENGMSSASMTSIYWD